MSKKARRLPPFVCEYKDQHGKIRIYLRKPGQKKIPLHGSPWSPAFMVEYGKAMYGEVPADGTIQRPALLVKPPELETIHGSWKWLCKEYMASTEFKALTGTTPDTRRRILESTWTERISPDSALVYGNMPLHKMTPLAVRVLRDRKSEFKTAANDRRKIMGYVFGWGMEVHSKLVLMNPVHDVKRLKHNVRNVPPWSEDNFHTFMQAYPPGSKARRAMSLHLYTGARGCDTRLFGPQHVKNGRFSFTQQKTGGEVDIPVLEELACELALAPKDDLAYILTEYGKTFSQKGYGTWFNDKCRKAGLLDRTAHGIRAGAATIAADNGATVHQLMSMFGWMSESMAIRYTKKANRKKLADSGMQLIRLGQRRS